MFDHLDRGVGLSEPVVLSGEGHVDFDADERLLEELTDQALADDWVEPVRHVLPRDLESVAPGLFLAAIVSSVDPERLNGHDAVRLMAARARLAAHHEAGKLEAMAEVAFSPPGNADSRVERGFDEMEYASVEVAAALRLTRRCSEAELDRAVCLKHRLRRVHEALAEGLIDLRRAQIFVRVLGHLPETTVEPVLDQILGQSSELTSGQLGDRLAKAVLAADPDGSAACFDQGLEDRKVTVYPNPDHTGDFLISNGDPAEITAARANIEKLARSLKTDDEPRTLDQLRHDVALDLLQGKCDCANSKPTSTGGGRTSIHVSAETLAGLSDEPGELAGYGPVFAEIARKVVRENIDGEWTFVVTDNGRPVATGTLARRPTASLQRQVRALRPKCVMVGCRFDAWDCDLDHRQQRRHGGDTCIHNLAPLCRHHHRSKDDGGWRLKRLDSGDHQWISPLGHTYTRRRGPP